MDIKFVEIQNFRKLKSTRIDFDQETTIFVGANNSGKTSAMLALRYFLISPNKLSLRDVTITNWTKIDEIGFAWERDEALKEDIESLLPSLDVWLDVDLDEIARVVHILPTINWSGGLLGVRLRYEVSDPDTLKSDYMAERAAADKVATVGNDKGKNETYHFGPTCLADFLEKHLTKYLDVQAYALDPVKCEPLKQGVAQPQKLSADALPLDRNPFKSLIRIDEIAAQRDFADAGERGSAPSGDDKSDGGTRRFKRKLSDQLRTYYDRHLDPMKAPSVEDYEALNAMHVAERNFDLRLKTGFSAAFEELEDLGYPGISNPKLKISTQLRTTDGLRHGSAVQYEVADPSGDGSKCLHLPEDYSGLGYQNLISMVFMLMSYRDDWMRVGKVALAASTENEDHIQPLHLVLVEEPEAHLHAQVQQVFIKKAYDLLRKHEDLGDKASYSTQLVVSTHSSHVAHEADFSNLRYFRRRRAFSYEETPTTTVANLSHVFGKGDETQRFVKRYLKATHCDLFFADGVIFVEGQAERILVPHFIRHHFTELSRRYVTLLDLGGSHAHRFKSLVDELGITTLIIADLDATQAHEVITKKGIKTTRWKATRPKIGCGQKTSNQVLKKWHPEQELIDDLLSLKPEDHQASVDDDYDLYVTYQKEVSTSSDENGVEKVIPRTFEDAFIFANQSILHEISGSSTTKKISDIVQRGISGENLADELFELLKDVEKAAFALDCLMYEDPQKLIPPPYIKDGLLWLQKALNERSVDTVTLEVTR